MNILYLLGNGFDLNIGLKTSYSDFFNYYNSLTTTNGKVPFLKESISKSAQNWADLEIGLGEFTDKLDTVDEFIEIFEDISDELAVYLEKEESLFDFSLINTSKFYADLCAPDYYLTKADSILLREYIDRRGKLLWKIRIITFNYTRSIEKIIRTEKLDYKIGTNFYGHDIKLKSIEHLHGYFDERMIMGVNDVTQISNKNFHKAEEILEAVVKPSCNAASKTMVDKTCADQIQSADLICIFGSSIGETDRTWWELIGDRLKTGARLIIFTRGNEINRRRPYKQLPHERQIRKYFFDRTNLTDSDKDICSKNVFVALNTEMFSHMRNQV